MSQLNFSPTNTQIWAYDIQNTKYFSMFLTHSSQQPCEVGMVDIIIPILLKFKAVRELDQGHTAI